MFEISLKGTLHFRNNLGSTDSLDPLNNEFVLKIRYSTHIMQKNSAYIFGQNLKSDFRAVLAYNV